MLKRLEELKETTEGTPFVQIDISGNSAFVKLEYLTLTGSIKVRPAHYILTEAIKMKEIDSESVVIESSSGNFAIALATLCKSIGIQFIPVIDPNITPIYEKTLRRLCKKVVKVSEADESGGYLLTRIAKVKELIRCNENAYWPNQYANKNNALAYYHSLGAEITAQFKSLDYIFIAVSSGGTITGVAMKIKEKWPNAQLVAVDVKGSVIFGKPPQKRNLSGLGSSLVPSLLDLSLVDYISILDELEIVKGCQSLFEDQQIFAGASSGAVYAAARSFLKSNKIKKAKILLVCPDYGTPYLDTVYDNDWVKSRLIDSKPQYQDKATV